MTSLYSLSPLPHFQFKFWPNTTCFGPCPVTLHCFLDKFRGVQPFGISGPHWKKKSCLGPHIKYTNTNENKKKSHNILSKFTILCWAAFTAILGRRLDTPAYLLIVKHKTWFGVLPSLLATFSLFKWSLLLVPGPLCFPLTDCSFSNPFQWLSLPLPPLKADIP